MTDEPVTVDGTAEDITGHDYLPARREARHEVLRPLDVQEQAAVMQVYQEGLRSILDQSDWQSNGDKPFVKKSGWRKIAAWFNLSLELDPARDHIDRDESGAPIRAQVWARAVAPNGRYADGDGYCAASEPRFSRAQGRQKLENDLRGTAATRATNRAISNLVGMGAVSAEEVEGGTDELEPLRREVEALRADAAEHQRRPYGPQIEKAEKGLVLAALTELLGSEDGATQVARSIVEDAGYMPQVVARTLVDVASARHDTDLPWHPDHKPDPQPDGETAAPEASS